MKHSYYEDSARERLFGLLDEDSFREALGPRRAGQPRWLGAVKGNIGHLDAASGVIALIKAAKIQVQ